MNKIIAALRLVIVGSIVSPAFASGETPKRKYAPPPAVDGFYYTDCFVRVKALPGASIPGRLNGTRDSTYIMYDGNMDSSITICHQATLSTTGIGEFVENGWSESKMKESGVQASRVKKNVNNDFAIIEIDEIIAANQKKHLYQKIIKTSDGYAVVTGEAECRKWSTVKDSIFAFSATKGRLSE